MTLPEAFFSAFLLTVGATGLIAVFIFLPLLVEMLVRLIEKHGIILTIVFYNLPMGIL